MIFGLEASTDAAMCAIFDPAALAHLLPVSWDDIQESVGLDDGILGKEEKAGNLTLFSIASDGTFRFRFYVDEPAPRELLAEATGKTARFLLRAPDGNLCAVGYEYLPSEESAVSKIEDYKVGDLGQSQKIPPGSYLVDAYSLSVPDTSSARPSSFVKRIGCVGCLSVPLVTVGACYFGGWPYLWVPCLVAVVSVAAVSEKGGRQGKPDLPDAVYVMTRLSDDADLSTMKGGSLGTW